MVAAAMAVAVRRRVRGSDPPPSPGPSTCYGTPPWSLPIVLLVMAIGAAIIVFSIVPVQWVRAMQAAVRKDDPVEEPLRVGERLSNDDDVPQIRKGPKTRRATGVFGADKFEGREADLEKAARVKREAPLRTTAEERRLRDWAEKLAQREAIVQETEEKLRREQAELDARILAPARSPSPGGERDETGATLEAGISGILARLETIERRLARRETVAASNGNRDVTLKDERLDSTERLERIAKRLADELDLDGRGLLARGESLPELEG